MSRRAFSREECRRGSAESARQASAVRQVGLKAARDWRESRRCVDCGALAYESCAHRPEGFGSVAAPQPIEWPIGGRGGAQ